MKNGTKDAGIMPMSGAAWRADMEVGHVYTLPNSGKPARLRPVDLLKLLEAGKIPNTLEGLVGTILWGEKPENDKVEDKDEAHQWLELAELICKASFTNPVIVDHPTANNEIGLEHIENADKLWVGEKMIGPTVALFPFRTRQGADVELVPDSEGDKRAAVKSG